jgi:hypothetical protein
MLLVGSRSVLFPQKQTDKQLAAFRGSLVHDIQGYPKNEVGQQAGPD